MNEQSQYGDGQVVTFRQFSEQNPAWSEGSLRWIRFNGTSNGADAAGVFVQQGRRIRIHKPSFFKWLEKVQRSA